MKRGAGRLKAEVLVRSPLWKRETKLRATIARAAEACAGAPLTPEPARAVVVVLTDDAAIRDLNRTWRGFDKPTNVLSFPAAATHDGHLGDIVIAYETMAREATHEGKSFADHLSHMVVHGVLHLAGFDHENAREARRMENRERAIFSATLGIADPYAIRPAAATPAVKPTARSASAAKRKSAEPRAPVRARVR